MHISNYPFVITFREEIDKLYQNGNKLSLIIVCGVCSELIAREIGNNEKIGYESMLNKLLEKNVITNQQYDLLNKIREIRNKYIHFSSSKIFESDGLVEEKQNGLLNFIEENVNDQLSEENLVELYSTKLKYDSDEIYRLLSNLLRI